jgi:hypothetical protein
MRGASVRVHDIVYACLGSARKCSVAREGASSTTPSMPTSIPDLDLGGRLLRHEENARTLA